jgi:hypothetical protein
LLFESSFSSPLLPTSSELDFFLFLHQIVALYHRKLQQGQIRRSEDRLQQTRVFWSSTIWPKVRKLLEFRTIFFFWFTIRWPLLRKWPVWATMSQLPKFMSSLKQKPQ